MSRGSIIRRNARARTKAYNKKSPQPGGSMLAAVITYVALLAALGAFVLVAWGNTIPGLIIGVLCLGPLVWFATFLVAKFLKATK
jgi:hypothetical protein